MTRQFIDLSIPICTDIVSDPEILKPQIEYMAHGETFPQMAPFFPGLVQDDLPDGEAWAVERVHTRPSRCAMGSIGRRLSPVAGPFLLGIGTKPWRVMNFTMPFNLPMVFAMNFGGGKRRQRGWKTLCTPR